MFRTGAFRSVQVLDQIQNLTLNGLQKNLGCRKKFGKFLVKINRKFLDFWCFRKFFNVIRKKDWNGVRNGMLGVNLCAFNIPINSSLPSFWKNAIFLFFMICYIVKMHFCSTFARNTHKTLDLFFCFLVFVIRRPMAVM